MSAQLDVSAMSTPTPERLNSTRWRTFPSLIFYRWSCICNVKEDNALVALFFDTTFFVRTPMQPDFARCALGEQHGRSLVGGCRDEHASRVLGCPNLPLLNKTRVEAQVLMRALRAELGKEQADTSKRR
jgi:hypothetical protein